jgi:hypothetical protein
MWLCLSEPVVPRAHKPRPQRTPGHVRALSGVQHGDSIAQFAALAAAAAAAAATTAELSATAVTQTYRCSQLCYLRPVQEAAASQRCGSPACSWAELGAGTALHRTKGSHTGSLPRMAEIATDTGKLPQTGRNRRILVPLRWECPTLHARSDTDCERNIFAAASSTRPNTCSSQAPSPPVEAPEAFILPGARRNSLPVPARRRAPAP